MKHKQVIAWVKTHKKQTIIISSIILALVIGGVVFALTRSDKPVVVNNVPVEEAKEEQPEPIRSPLSGLEVTQAEADRAVTAVIIENSPEARPQSGVRSSGIVFESIAEGGITRFVTLHQEDRPDPIGPVRSLRPYFSDWGLAFDASVVHFGGSAEALEEVKSIKLKDIDCISSSASVCYRTTDRYAPHNAYSNFDRIDKRNKELGYTKSEFKPFERKDEEPLEKPKATKISVNFSSSLFRADYTYDKESNSYKRSIAGGADKDRDSGKRISPKTLVVIHAPYTISSDGRYHYDLTGEGAATYFQDGNVQKGKWKKDARNKEFQFVDGEGNPVKFNRGQMWVSVLSPSQAPTY